MFNALRASVFAMSFLTSDNHVRLQARSLFRDGFVRDLPFVDEVSTKLTAACFTPRGCRDLREAADMFDAPLREAEAQESPFVAFPELSGLALLGLLPRHEQVLSSLRAGLSRGRDVAAAAREAVQISQGFLSEVFLNTLSVLARGHRMQIAAGGLYVWEDGELRNRQYLFSENGDLLGWQDKLILSPFEREMGVVPARRLTPIETRVGRVVMLPASCARHYEPFAAAAAMGCRIVTAGASPFGGDTAPLVHRAREQSLVLVCPGLGKSDLFPSSREIPAEIFLPRRRVSAKPGETGGKSVTARVDLSGAPAFDHYTADRSLSFFVNLLSGEDPDADALLDGIEP